MKFDLDLHNRLVVYTWMPFCNSKIVQYNKIMSLLFTLQSLNLLKKHILCCSLDILNMYMSCERADNVDTEIYLYEEIWFMEVNVISSGFLGLSATHIRFMYFTEQEKNYCSNTDNWYMSSLYFKIKEGRGVHYNKSLEGVRGSPQKAGGTTLSVEGGTRLPVSGALRQNGVHLAAFTQDSWKPAFQSMSTTSAFEGLQQDIFLWLSLDTLRKDELWFGVLRRTVKNVV